MRCIVPHLPVAPAHSEGELEASIEKLFRESGSGNHAEQGEYVGDEENVDTQLVSDAVDTAAEDVAPVQLELLRKRKSAVVSAGEASHPTKRLREDHRALGRATAGGKSSSVLKRLLTGAVLNAEVGVKHVATLPFLTSSVSATPEHSSHHSDANVADAEADSFFRSSIPVITAATTITLMVNPASAAKEKTVDPSLFLASSPLGGTEPTIGGFSDLTGSDFLVGGIRIVINPASDLQKVYVPQ
ncbi:hypothetical protein Tco_0755826 [Tanacetum coccineum]